jgi:transposase InsO family protein
LFCHEATGVAGVTATILTVSITLQNGMPFFLDLKTRVIKGYKIKEGMPTHLVTAALENAFKNNPGISGAILHSDRGCQYTSREYAQKLQDYGLKISMSATGNCYDNAGHGEFLVDPQNRMLSFVRNL